MEYNRHLEINLFCCFCVVFQDMAVTGAAAVKPSALKTCRETDCVYAWSPGQWSNCNKECDLGAQQRQVTCVWVKGHNDRETVNNTHCDPTRKPSSMQSCYLDDCTYAWSTSDWSSCSVPVCGEGHQQRTVICQWLRSNGLKVTVADSNCYTARPASIQSCSVKCVYEWATTSWGTCTGLCEQGVTKRAVFCEWLKNNELREVVSDVQCSSITKPHPSKSCDLQKCEYRWLTKEWGVCNVDCGEGSQSREVVCMWEDLLLSESHSEGADSAGADVAVVEDSMCRGEGVKPSLLTTCHVPYTCPQWHTTDWSKVSTLL